jgi:hypothetical protein
MTCDACTGYDFDERAAIEREELPIHDLGECACASEGAIDVLALPSWRLHPDGDLSRFAVRHIGIACRMLWPELCGYLSRAVAGDPERYADADIAKRQEGGYVGGLYRGNWRHTDAFVRTQILTMDIDGHGEIERAAEAFAPFRKAIHSTYKSKPEAPRCRVVLQLARPCTSLAKYRAAHAALRERLYSWGYIRADKAQRIAGDLDRGASDATRLNYGPMYRPPYAPAFLATDGELLDIDRVPAPAKAQLSLVPSTRERNPDKYREGALRGAEAEMRSAMDGQRHETLYKEAASLSRAELGLSDEEIASVLGPAALSVMGEGRHTEVERTIRDGIARGRAGK